MRRKNLMSSSAACQYRRQGRAEINSIGCLMWLLNRHGDAQAFVGRNEVIEILGILANIDLNPVHLPAAVRIHPISKRSAAIMVRLPRGSSGPAQVCWSISYHGWSR